MNGEAGRIGNGVNPSGGVLQLIGPGVTQTGVLVALIISAAQPFGTEWFKSFLGSVFGLQDIVQYSMAVAALVISLLVAVWQVRYIQKLCGGMCVISSVLVWLILFSMAVGGNNSFKTAVGFGQTGDESVMSEEDIRALVEENQSIREQLDGTLALVQQLRGLIARERSEASEPWYSLTTNAYAQNESSSGGEDTGEGYKLTEEQYKALDLKLQTIQMDLEALQKNAVKMKFPDIANSPALQNQNKIMY